MTTLNRLAVAVIALAAFQGACAGCDGYGDLPDAGRDNPFGEPNNYPHDRDGAFGTETDAAGDVGVARPDADREDAGPNGGSADVTDSADAPAATDAGTDDGPDPEDLGPLSTCGDGVTEGPEACDDANVNDGDYCAGDCSAVTGRCGDGIRQANEACDDGATADCAGTHDGGAGSCVPAGSCSANFVLDAAGNCVANPTGLTTSCQNGPGWTLFRFHYNNNSTSAQIDVWDASCSYSFAPNSACNVREVYPGFGEVSRTSQGYPIFTSSNYMRVRFDAGGLNFTQVTLWIQARSYATSSSTYYDVWSPLYGEKEGGPVDNDFVYDWYPLDWTGYLFPSDDPGLTAIQLYGGRGSGSLAVSAVELCVQ